MMTWYWIYLPALSARIEVLQLAVIRYPENVPPSCVVVASNVRCDCFSTLSTSDYLDPYDCAKPFRHPAHTTTLPTFSEMIIHDPLVQWSQFGAVHKSPESKETCHVYFDPKVYFIY